MLIRFRVENFRSIRDEQELSLVASPFSERAETLIRSDRYDLDLLPAVAIYGPNASGKSTLLDALDFMKDTVRDSQRLWQPGAAIPRVPFALREDPASEPSFFSIDLIIEGVRYEYGFIVDSSRVLEEWLSAYPKDRRQDWFTRDSSREDEFKFSRLLKGENRLIASITRPNSLFLSAAAQSNHPALSLVYEAFSRMLVISESNRLPLELSIKQFCLEDALREQISSMLREADLGMTAVEVVEEEAGAVAGRLNVNLHESDATSVFPYAPRAVGGVQFRHRSASGQDVSLPFDQESQGTRAMFSLAGAVVLTLRAGGILAVDELDRSLHPHLAVRIIDLFSNPETNPHGAQLIFNTHDTNLLDGSVLRRDQVWFTEKGDDGATRLYPLTDFKARKHENLERGYLQGRYGAVPVLGDLDAGVVAGS